MFFTEEASTAQVLPVASAASQTLIMIISYLVVKLKAI